MTKKKINAFPVPEDLTLDEISQRFNTDEAALECLEAVFWPNGPVCPHCENANAARIWKIRANEAKGIRLGLYHCAECDKHFRVTVGTVFEDSKIPIRKWLVAWYLVCSSKKGVSSLQLQRQLDLGSYRTALFMTHRIRHALRDPAFNDKLSGTVEADETYVGGVKRGMGRRYVGNKASVVALVERGGRVRSQVMEKVTGKTLKAALNEHVEQSARIMTDELSAYRKAAKGYASHESVNHSAKEYVRGDVTTNTVEGFFSLLKRGVIGTFHSVSKRHLPLYLAEFDHRYSTRNQTDGERTVAGMKKARGKRLMLWSPRPAKQA